MTKKAISDPVEVLVMLCPDCHGESIGTPDDSGIMRCAHCRRYVGRVLLEHLIEFLDRPWLRKATEDERKRLTNKNLADWHRRQAALLDNEIGE